MFEPNSSQASRFFKLEVLQNEPNTSQAKHYCKQHSQLQVSPRRLCCVSVKCCLGWESNQIRFLIQATIAIPQTSKECSYCNAKARSSRSCLHPLSYGYTTQGELSVTRRPTTHSARMQIQSVSQVATEVPVLQIWTDQSPQP